MWAYPSGNSRRQARLRDRAGVISASATATEPRNGAP